MLNKIRDFFSHNNRKKHDKWITGRCVLLVDDNRVDQMLVKNTLDRLGCRVLLAENGEEALQIAKIERPDIILSDCQMPKMDGIEMCKRFKEDPATRPIPLIFLTSIDTPQNIVDCFDVGVDSFMCKPINPKILTAQIRDVLEEHLVTSEFQ